MKIGCVIIFSSSASYTIIMYNQQKMINEMR